MIGIINRQTEYYLKQIARYNAFRESMLEPPVQNEFESREYPGLFYDVTTQFNWALGIHDIKVHAKAQILFNAPFPNDNCKGVLKFICQP